MQVSSAYDFEKFAQKIKTNTTQRLKEIETESSAYLLEKEHLTQEIISGWLNDSKRDWEIEKERMSKNTRHTMESEATAAWSAFLAERKEVFILALRNRLEEQFDTLARCFVAKIIESYDEGTFTMPLRYGEAVPKEGFTLVDTDKNEVIYTRGNLYIEYSVKRILDELEDDVNRYFQTEDEIWQG